MEFGLTTLLGDHAARLADPALIEDAITVSGDPKRFAAFAEIPQLRTAVAAMDAWDGRPKSARAWSPSGTKTPFEIFATRDQLKTLYEAGCTIVLENVDGFVPAIRPLCRQLEADLGVAPGKINVEVFCALRGGHGRPHFDPSFTFNCQIHGTKSWTIARNPAVRFPPARIGMFLGRPPEPALEAVLTQPLPTCIENGATFVAEPGAVVFLPPGVLHETHMETASFAIAFAIDLTDCVASQVASRLESRLQRVPGLRAARLGGQSASLRPEAALVAAELRAMADALDAGEDPWWTSNPRARIRPGLSAEIVNETSIALRGVTTTRTMTLAPAMVSLLGWASRRGVFSMQDAAVGLGQIDPVLVEGCVRQLIFAGLMERAQ